MTTRMRNNILGVLLFVLAISALVLSISWVSGCASPPATPSPAPAAPQPGNPTQPPPQADMRDCVGKIRSMQSAVAIAKIGAALMVSKDSKYGPAVKIALAAIDGALIAAQIQCDGGTPDKWQIALAAFDAAFAQLVSAGEGLSANVVPEDDGTAPPYAISLEQFNAMAFEKEMEWQ